MSTSSSPFPDYRSNASIVVSEASSNKQYVAKLEFQLQTMLTEKRILQEEKEQISDNYTKIIKDKNQQIENLKLNFKFVYDEKVELESKLKNQEQTSSGTNTQLQRELDASRERYYKVQQDYNSLVAKYNAQKSNAQKLEYDLKSSRSINEQLEQQLKIKEEQNKSLQKATDDAMNELNEYAKLLKSDKQPDHGRGSAYQNLMTRNTNLQNLNFQLQTKIDGLLQNKTSVELLKQQNQSLLAKIQNLQNTESKYLQLEIEKLKADRKYNDLFKSLDAAIATGDENEDVTNTVKVKKFIDYCDELQAKNLTLQEKYDAKVLQVKELTQELEDSAREIENEYLPTITDLESKLKLNSAEIVQLERTKALREKEIEFLRNLLKNMEEINSKKQTEEKPIEEDKAILQYMTNLEKLVDEYKTKIEDLEKKAKAMPVDATNGTPQKRQRTDHSNSFMKQASDLEKQNIELSSKLKQAESVISELQSKISELETVHTKQEEYRILQLKNNLINQDQFIKQSTLDALRHENEDLINKYVNHLDPSELIPRSVFQRQEDDKDKLQLQINQLSKRINRLRDAFTKKSKDIITVIAKYFGFIIEFLPNPINPNDLFSRIKLRSRYIPVEEDCYLIIDIENRGLKAHGSYQFKTLCEDLAKYWVDENNQFPCLLSAVNLKLYEIYSK
ncbi:Spindle assembly checkpoint component MAD1 [Candida viswanathii]|uniref:Spindle assembly checkpoint component MAD1 n=1 Tax=Candida viswanathii TaxID=5486 RepID=A0A367YDU7_9ASCO|nr:Spindle assembly checkpoint component MAD1 [Candida viswanathii]